MSLATERSVRMEDPVVVPEKGGVMLQEASHYDNFSDLECHCARKFQDNAPHKKNTLLHYFKDNTGKLFTADQTLVLYSLMYRIFSAYHATVQYVQLQPLST